MICPYCNQPARWVDNAEIYGKRYGLYYMMWWCQPCDALVGCHKNTRRPLGTMANRELRGWRQKAHKAFDPLWKEGWMTRSEAYQYLSHHFGKDMHIGESDIDTCRMIIDFINQEKMIGAL